MHFTVEAQSRIQSHLHSLQGSCQEWSSPNCVVDATAGNGFDTEFLARLVGENGLVVAIDLQPNAIDSARQRLEQSDAPKVVEFVVGSHADMQLFVNQLKLTDRFGESPLAVVMFNLGYLPFGDKSVITTSHSTLPALDQAFGLLKNQGMLSVLSYPGHAGGSDEHRMVEQWFESRGDSLKIERFQDKNNHRSPVLWLAVKALVS